MPTAETLLSTPQEHIIRSRKHPWYNESINGKLDDKIREILKVYSHIPEEDIEPHIYKVVS
jgi:hypothetical protein